MRKRRSKAKDGVGHGGRGSPKFEPTPEQRRMVAILSGFMLPMDQIRLLLVNPATNKPITKTVLNRRFRSELNTGSAALKALIARKFVDALEAGEPYAVRLGLRNKLRWSIAENGALPAEMLGDGNDAEMKITFVLPSSKSEPVDVTAPSPYEGKAADLTRKALPKPTTHSVEPGHGLGPWRTDRDPNSWMK